MYARGMYATCLQSMLETIASCMPLYSFEQPKWTSSRLSPLKIPSPIQVTDIKAQKGQHFQLILQRFIIAAN